jgi:pilus assembly protein Flp/PilA
VENAKELRRLFLFRPLEWRALPSREKLKAPRDAPRIVWPWFLISALAQELSAMKNDFGAHFFKDQSGTTAIEYGLIAALMSVVCIAGMVLVGNGLTGV